MPEQKDIESIARVFRLFYGKSNTTHFPRLRNLVYKNTEDDNLKSFLERLNSHWKEALSRSFYSEYHKRDILAEELINMWFNGLFFHTDREKYIELEDINQILTTEYSRFELFLSIVSASGVIVALAKSMGTISTRHLTFRVPDCSRVVY